MLKTQLLQPEILAALAASGHGSQILIADGNYPFITKSPPGAAIVYLNLAPDVVTVIDALRPIIATVPLELYTVMDTPPDMEKPAIFKEFEALLAGIPEQRLDRFAFYDAASDPKTSLVIATAERRIYANLLLTIGVMPP